MNNRSRKKKHNISRVWEFIILTAIGSVVCVFIMFSLASRFTCLKANEVMSSINSMIDEAYKTSKELEKMNITAAKMDIDGCVLVNNGNAWYMLCNLNEMTNGDEDEQNLILKDFVKYKKHGSLMLTSASEIENIKGLDVSTGEEKYIAMFIRFSSAKDDKDSNLS